MTSNWEKGSRFTTKVRYAATDTSVTLQAKHADSSNQLRVRRIQARIVTSFAEAVTFKDSSGTVILMVIPASAAAGTLWDFGPFDDGVPLTANNDLVMSSGAGPALDVVVEGMIGGR